MAVLDTKHKRNSAVITSTILLLLVLGILNYGMRYLDPPEEYGLVINFGDANIGSGKPVVNAKKNNPKETKEVIKEEVETLDKKITDNLITDESIEELPVVKKAEIKKPLEKEVVKTEIPQEKPKPKPSKETQDALNKLLNGNTQKGETKGEGDDKTQGVKGKKMGNEYSSKYYGNTGDGSGGDYNLSGRKALSKPKEQPDCQEEGTVVVRITVNNQGQVIEAIPGVKGSTNTASCLLKPAKAAALKTIWNADKDAPKIQVGTIVYKFSLSE